MKNILKIVLSIVITSVILFSCENEEVSIQEEQSINIEKLLFNKYDLSKIDNSDIDLSRIGLINENYNKNDVILYKFNYSNEQMAIFPNSLNSSKYLVYRGDILGKEGVISKKLEITFSLDETKSGTVTFLNIQNRNNFSMNFEEGKPIYNYENTSSDSTIKAKSLCQQQGSEGFKGCFKRESDEFQSDFISTLAYLTNPTIAVLIAGLCTC